jgi:hypothetical protein
MDKAMACSGKYTDRVSILNIPFVLTDLSRRFDAAGRI